MKVQTIYHYGEKIFDQLNIIFVFYKKEHASEPSQIIRFLHDLICYDQNDKLEKKRQNLIFYDQNDKLDRIDWNARWISLRFLNVIWIDFWVISFQTSKRSQQRKHQWRYIIVVRTINAGHMLIRVPVKYV